MNPVNPAIFNRVQSIVADLFSIPVAQVKLETSSDTIDNWDSLQHLNLVLALEQQFGVQFAPQEIEKLISVQSIVEFLEHKLQAAGKTL
jgi:acyl carrier protein